MRSLSQELRIQYCSRVKPSLIWCDPVNIFESLVWFLHLSFREQGQQQPWQVMATIDQADIRGSEPHNHDPSGAPSDCYRKSGRACRIGKARVLLGPSPGSARL